MVSIIGTGHSPMAVEMLKAMHNTEKNVSLIALEMETNTILENLKERNKKEMLDLENLQFKQFAKENGIDISGEKERKERGRDRCMDNYRKKRKGKKKRASQSKKKNKKR